MKITLVRIVWIVGVFWAARSMSLQLAPRRFEAAAIKSIAPGSRSGAPTTACKGIDGTIPSRLTPANRDVPLGRCTGIFTLKFFVAYAYDVDPANVTGVKDWMALSFYDIEAVADNPATVTKQDIRMMFQTLLAERFKLKAHPKTYQIPGYNLVVGKSGAKMKPASEDAKESYSSPPPQDGSRPVKGTGSMPYLASVIAGILKASVSDRTGLNGKYEFHFTYPMRVDSTGPALFTTIEDLGLHLEESAKVSQDFMVIDSAEKPVPDPF